MNIPRTKDQLLAIDPDSLTEPLPWNALLMPGEGLFGSNFEVRDERRRLGLPPDRGILHGDPGQSRAWATACYITTTVGKIETERFRLRAVQIAIREGCCAWHAASLAADDVERCPCARCADKRAA